MTSGPGVLGWVCGLGLVAWASAGLAAEAVTDLDHRYPKGSIASPATAERALTDAAAATRALDSQYEAERKRCAQVFLATKCMDSARRTHMLGRAQAQRIEVEAHDLQRSLAARQRETSRDLDLARQSREDAQRPEKERQAENAAQKRVDGAEQRQQDARRQQAQAPETRDRFEKRNAEHDRDQAKRASVQIRSSAENALRYQDKQARAKAYAASRARERDENQKVRAERERERQLKTQTAQGSTPVDPVK
jgi:hypothetical protein